jgi:Gpi18-like mannosyltransferase
MTLSSSFRKGILRLIPGLGKSVLLDLLIVGLVIRFILIPFTSHPNDLQVLYIMNNDLLAGLNVYSTNSFTYPPLWAYSEFPALGLSSLLVSPKLFGVRVDALNLSSESWNLPPVITTPLFNILSKLPLIVGDVLIGVLLYKIVKGFGKEKLAKLSFILWFFNPLVIFVDSIHGQFDVLPTLMTVLGFCFLLRRNYFSAGLSIGLGTLFKIYPIFLAPLYLSMTSKLEIGELQGTKKSLRKILAGWLKLSIGILASFVMFLPPLINTNVLHDVSSKATVATLGGLSPFDIAYYPRFDWLLPFIFAHASLVTDSLLILLSIIIVLVSVVVFLRKGDLVETFVLGHIAILLAIYLTSLTVNPQYILWILPFLILSYGLFHYNLKNMILISISALAFWIGLTGPLFYLYPLAVFARIFSVKTIYANVFFFQHVQGWIILLYSGLVGVFALIVCLAGSMMHLLEKDGESTLPRSSSKKKQLNMSQLIPEMNWRLVNPRKILTLVLIVLLFGQFLTWAQPLMQQNVSFAVLDIGPNQNDIRVDYMLTSGNYPVDIQVFSTPAISTSSGPADKSIFIYYDDAYPTVSVPRNRWIGLLDHAPVELQLRGYKGSINIIDAEGLRTVMETNQNSIIIVPSGVFPETVHAENQSIVGNWLRAGGTLVWMGDAFGYFSGIKNGGTQLFSNDNITTVQNQILGFTLFNNMSTETEFASTPSGFSTALDLRYPDALVGAYVSDVLEVGGIVLGKVTESTAPRASISCVPVGDGHLILFGGNIGNPFTSTGEDVIAHDIAQILCSGFPFSTGISAFNLTQLGRNETKKASLDVPLPPAQNVTGIIIAVFSESPYNRYFTRQFYSTSHN